MQLLKAEYPIEVTYEGIKISLSNLQFSNAWFPILLTQDGMENFESILRPQKQKSPISTFSCSINKWKISKFWFFKAPIIDVKYNGFSFEKDI